jgi:hypothetical protein
MNSVTLKATVSEDHRLIIDLPGDIPPGPVEVMIRPASNKATRSKPLTREEARAILLAAGFLVTDLHIPDGIEPLTPDELLDIGSLPDDAPPSEKLIDEDRGEY